MKIDNSLPLEYSTEENSLKILGFWIFLGAEIDAFRNTVRHLFHVRNRTGNGPTGQNIF